MEDAHVCRRNKQKFVFSYYGILMKSVTCSLQIAELQYFLSSYVTRFDLLPVYGRESTVLLQPADQTLAST